jgi:diaminohydroxyphosphoribosylaminopyrimidine deaminase/5-amino-6-(5-phosphoribosylamino)uracil reductase
MRHAARLAIRGHGGAEPNPMVGCIIVNGGEIIGSGYHRRCGGPHAEIEAITAAGDATTGATMYVTLEPCHHTGRTGPCTLALIDAGIAHVIIGQRDPNPVGAGGIETLTDHGIDVTLLKDEASAAVSRPFRHCLTARRPWVIAKWAETRDGFLTTPAGESPWISSGASQRLVHRQRGRVDAIITGIGTVLADDPLLTPRCRNPRRIPVRVVLDTHLRTPLDSQLVMTATTIPVVIYCQDDAPLERVLPLQSAGVTVVPIASTDSHVDLHHVLNDLAQTRGVTTSLLEAGPRLLTAFFDQGLVSETLVFTAPAPRHPAGGSTPCPGRDTPGLGENTLITLGQWRRDGDTVTNSLVAPLPTPGSTIPLA